MGKGGSSTNVAIPEWLEAAAKRNLGQADKISRLGPVPLSYGPTVADFTDAQYAGFNNTANTASAFGLNAPGAYSMGNPAATTYDNGVRALSAAPLFEGKMDAFAAARPGQKSYIDSFFIDPFTGGVGSNVAPLVNYDNYQTFADATAAQQANDLAIAQANQPGSALSTSEFNNYVSTIQEAIGDPTYNPATDVLTQSQIDAINQDQDAQLAQDAIYMNQLGNANATIGDAFTTLTGGEPSFDDPSGAGSYGGSLVTGELSTDLLGIPGLVGEVADNIYQKVDFEGAVEKQGENFAEAAGSTLQDDGTYDISNWFTDTSATPTIDVSNRPFGFETYEPTIGMPTPAPASANAQVAPVAGPDAIAYGGNLAEETGLILSDLSDEEFFAALESDPTLDPYINYGSSNDNDSYTPVPTTSSGATVIPTGTTIATGTVLNKADDPVVEVDGKLYNQSNAPAPAPAPSGGGGGGNDGGGGGGGVCVVATHAVNSGAFTPSMKREAVVWCMNVLHDKWWGEAIRRGYRHLGRKKIEQGKAHEHYQEFRDYIAFANGKKRTLKGAINFTLRTAQFFAVGLIKKEA
jgi:hypothetical protein